MWVAQGSGDAIINGQPADPDVLGVAPGTSVSMASKPDGSWVAAWHGTDTQNPGGSLWIATGTGTTITAVGDPDVLGVTPGTSPSIVTRADGSWEVAWNGGGSLWLAHGTGTNISGQPAAPYSLGVAPGTSPALTALTNGGVQAAWHGSDTQNANGSLWLAQITGDTTIVGQPADPDALGVAAGTSPSITTRTDGSWEVAWNGGGNLWLAHGTGTIINGQPADPDVLGMAPGTNPALTALSNGDVQAAWHGSDTQNASGSLWLAQITGDTAIVGQPADPDVLGVAAGTSPSIITRTDGSWEVAWNGGGNLWLAHGTGTIITGDPADPDVLGIV
ncbi:hypothetical protein ACFQ9X_24540 [Catenulispora yoronensis]